MLQNVIATYNIMQPVGHIWCCHYCRMNNDTIINTNAMYKLTMTYLLFSVVVIS